MRERRGSVPTLAATIVPALPAPKRGVPCSKWAHSGHSSIPQEAGRGTGDGRRRRMTAATARPREGPRCPSEIPSPPGLPTTFSLPPRYQMPYLRISLHVTRWTHRKTEKIVQKCNSRNVCPTRLVGKLANAGRHCGYLRCMWVDSSVWYPGLSLIHI